MFSLQKQRRGDASIIIIIILLMVIIGGVVWYALAGSNTKTADSSPDAVVSAKPTATPDPQAGWKTSTLKYEKFSYKYPADWTVTDTSTTGVDAQDRIAIKSPDGFVINIQTGVGGVGGNCEDCKTFETTNETILGEKTGVNIYGSSKGAQGIGLMRLLSGGKTTYDCLGLCTIPGKNTPVKFTDGELGLTLVTGGYKLSDSEAIQLGTSAKTINYETFKADSNVTTAKLIFKSFTY